MGTETDFVDATGLGVLDKGADELGGKYSASAQGIDIGRPDSCHECAGVVGQRVTPFIGSTVGGPIRTSEEIGEGTDMAEGLKGGVQVAVVGDVAESASVRC